MSAGISTGTSTQPPSPNQIFDKSDSYVSIQMALASPQAKIQYQRKLAAMRQAQRRQNEEQVIFSLFGWELRRRNKELEGGLSLLQTLKIGTVTWGFAAAVGAMILPFFVTGGVSIFVPLATAGVVLVSTLLVYFAISFISWLASTLNKTDNNHGLPLPSSENIDSTSFKNSNSHSKKSKPNVTTEHANTNQPPAFNKSGANFNYLKNSYGPYFLKELTNNHPQPAQPIVESALNVTRRVFTSRP